MANEIFMLSLAITAALSVTDSAEIKPNRLLNTLYEKSFQDRKYCFHQFKDQLSGFLQEVTPPEKANRTAIHRIGKESAEIIDRKVKAMMGNCSGASLQVSPFVVTHMNKDGRNFYVEQIVIQKILIKPILIVDRIDVSVMQVLAVRINETMHDKLRIEITNEKLSKEPNALEIEIRRLEAELRNATADRDAQAAEGKIHHDAFMEVDKVLQIEKRKFNELKDIVDYIIRNACGCQNCKANQIPNWTSFLASKPPTRPN
ncbi:uncharacterized protein LOC130703799 [Daphnia carinata]|uniref:uncharacterized protein LOC130703799 n=1 Tax=Daphnia carinata TaxID=120202 RepID=UPI00257DD5C8|nr:uncharacterized protein LOC130703799 [Daphnia carinata]